MNVFDIAEKYVALERMASDENLSDDDLLDAWLAAEGELSQKIENIGFLIKNRVAALNGMKEAADSLGKRIKSMDNEIERWHAVLLRIMQRTDKKKVVGTYLQISWQFNGASVKVTDEMAIPTDYMRWVPPSEGRFVPDKEKILADLKEGVIIDGVERQQTARVVIK